MYEIEKCDTSEFGVVAAQKRSSASMASLLGQITVLKEKRLEFTLNYDACTMQYSERTVFRIFIRVNTGSGLVLTCGRIETFVSLMLYLCPGDFVLIQVSTTITMDEESG